jgi:phage host-nuclease inhibitor protein Gam
MEQQQAQETSFMDNLLGFLNEEEEQGLGIQQEEGFQIDSMDQANYFARKLREVRAEKSEAEAAAKQQIEAYKERVDRWLSSIVSPIEYEEERILALLENFAETKLSGSSKRSLKLIEGTLQFRKQQPKYDYNDEVLLDHAQAVLPSYVKTKPSVDKAELKKALKVKSGKAYIGDKVVPGITITELPDKFDVK